MNLEVVTPTAVVVRETDVRQVNAEDATGRFGILPGHADFLTALSVSVLSWRRHDDATTYCAVRGGILTVRDGNSVAVATQQAICGDDLQHLEVDVLQRLRAADEEERDARIHARRLHLAAVQQLLRYARPGALPQGPGSLAHRDDGRGGDD